MDGPWTGPLGADPPPALPPPPEPPLPSDVDAACPLAAELGAEFRRPADWPGGLSGGEPEACGGGPGCAVLEACGGGAGCSALGLVVGGPCFSAAWPWSSGGP